MDILVLMFMFIVGCCSRISWVCCCLVIVFIIVVVWYDIVWNLMVGLLVVVNFFVVVCGYGFMIGDMWVEGKWDKWKGDEFYRCWGVEIDNDDIGWCVYRICEFFY